MQNVSKNPNGVPYLTLGSSLNFLHLRSQRGFSTRTRIDTLNLLIVLLSIMKGFGALVRFLRMRNTSFG